MADERRMERLRADLIRRARLERRGSNTEGGAQSQPATEQVEMRENNPDNTESSQRQLRLSRLMLGGGSDTSGGGPEGVGLEGPKTPEVSRNRLNQPSFYMTPNGRPVSVLVQLGAIPSIPETAVLASNGIGPGPGVGGATQPMASGTSNPGSQRTGDARIHGRRGRRKPPKRFLFCFPWVKSRLIRAQLVQCFVPGLFVALLLAVYLGLTLSRNVVVSELNIMMILIILMAAVFFCYCIIRLFVLAIRRDRIRGNGLESSMDPRGYAIPRTPIRVVMVQDEEAAGVESETAKTKPPAYGLWRESVRVDPNRLFWQRNEAADAMPQSEMPGPRPPSYISEDGVSYVVDAAPRSVAPPVEVPQPVVLHPSEAGRLGQPPPQ